MSIINDKRLEINNLIQSLENQFEDLFEKYQNEYSNRKIDSIINAVAWNYAALIKNEFNLDEKEMELAINIKGKTFAMYDYTDIINIIENISQNIKSIYKKGEEFENLCETFNKESYDVQKFSNESQLLMRLQDIETEFLHFGDYVLTCYRSCDEHISDILKKKSAEENMSEIKSTLDLTFRNAHLYDDELIKMYEKNIINELK